MVAPRRRNPWDVLPPLPPIADASASLPGLPPVPQLRVQQPTLQPITINVPKPAPPPHVTAPQLGQLQAPTFPMPPLPKMPSQAQINPMGSLLARELIYQAAPSLAQGLGLGQTQAQKDYAAGVAKAEADAALVAGGYKQPTTPKKAPQTTAEKAQARVDLENATRALQGLPPIDQANAAKIAQQTAKEEQAKAAQEAKVSKEKQTELLHPEQYFVPTLQGTLKFAQGMLDLWPDVMPTDVQNIYDAYVKGGSDPQTDPAVFFQTVRGQLGALQEQRHPTSGETVPATWDQVGAPAETPQSDATSLAATYAMDRYPDAYGAFASNQAPSNDAIENAWKHIPEAAGTTPPSDQGGGPSGPGGGGPPPPPITPKTFGNIAAAGLGGAGAGAATGRALSSRVGMGKGALIGAGIGLALDAATDPAIAPYVDSTVLSVLQAALDVLSVPREMSQAGLTDLGNLASRGVAQFEDAIGGKFAGTPVPPTRSMAYEMVQKYKQMDPSIPVPQRLKAALESSDIPFQQGLDQVAQEIDRVEPTGLAAGVFKFIANAATDPTMYVAPEQLASKVGLGLTGAGALGGYGVSRAEGATPQQTAENVQSGAGFGMMAQPVAEFAAARLGLLHQPSAPQGIPAPSPLTPRGPTAAPEMVMSPPSPGETGAPAEAAPVDTTTAQAPPVAEPTVANTTPPQVSDLVYPGSERPLTVDEQASYQLALRDAQRFARAKGKAAATLRGRVQARLADDFGLDAATSERFLSGDTSMFGSAVSTPPIAETPVETPPPTAEAAPAAPTAAPPPQAPSVDTATEGIVPAPRDPMGELEAAQAQGQQVAPTVAPSIPEPLPSPAVPDVTPEELRQYAALRVKIQAGQSLAPDETTWLRGLIDRRNGQPWTPEQMAYIESVGHPAAAPLVETSPLPESPAPRPETLLPPELESLPRYPEFWQTLNPDERTSMGAVLDYQRRGLPVPSDLDAENVELTRRYEAFAGQPSETQPALIQPSDVSAGKVAPLTTVPPRVEPSLTPGAKAARNLLQQTRSNASKARGAVKGEAAPAPSTTPLPPTAPATPPPLNPPGATGQEGPLTVGDEFVHQGRRYVVREVNGGVRADDMSGRYPIGRAWIDRAQFEREVGHPVAAPTDATSPPLVDAPHYDKVTGQWVKITDLPSGAHEVVWQDGRKGTEPRGSLNPRFEPDERAVAHAWTQSISPQVPSPAVQSPQEASHGQPDLSGRTASGPNAETPSLGQRSGPDGNDQGALAQVSPESVSGRPAERDTEPVGDVGRPAHDQSGGESDPLRDGSVLGVVGRDAGDRPSGIAPESAPDLVAPPPATPTQLRDVNLHRVEENLGQRTVTQRLDDNLEALSLLLKLRKEERLATPTEQATLLKYAGWGDSAYEYLFDKRGVTGKDFQRRELFQSLLGQLSEEERQALVKSRKTAFYTTPPLIKAIWSGLRTLGIGDLNRIRVLEPSAGVGNFLGFQPQSLVGKSARTAVELDRVTGDILKHLYQNADVQVAGLQDALLPNGHFDVAISNVPFGNEGIVDRDPAYMGANNRWKTRSIHTYFMVKALDKIRPGGVEAFIVSHNALDAQAHDVLRQSLARTADLVGAVRLPRDIFPDTSVTTDIIFLRKLKPGETPKDTSWADSVPVRIDYEGKVRAVTEGGNARISRYFLKHPDHVLGQHAMGRGMYGDNEYQVQKTVGATTDDILEKLRKALGDLPKGIIEPERDPVSTTAYAPQVINSVKEGAYSVQDGKLVVRRGSGLESAKLSPTDDAKVRSMLTVRDAARDVLNRQLAGVTDAELHAAQSALQKAHDAFVAKYKALNHPTNRRLMADDPDGPFLLSLEKWDSKREAALKSKYGTDSGYGAADIAGLRAPIFSQRIIRTGQKIEKVDTAHDALVVSLRERNGIDLDRMQALTGLNETTLINHLGDRVYRNPTGSWEPSEQYLSGNVRQKLQEAQQAAVLDPSLQRNVAALQAVLPENVPYSQMDVRLGAQWLPETVVNQFLHETLGYYGQTVPQYVKWNAGAAEWTMTQAVYGQSAEARSRFATPTISVQDVVRHAMNGDEPTIRVPGDTPGSTVVDPIQTQAARDKVFALRQAFKDWLWTDLQRTDDLTKLYNERYNYFRETKWDGAHLDLAGSNPAIRLMPHQKAAIWRILQNGNTLLAHEVGFGKSKIMIGAGMEARRLGLAKKNLYVVPNHLVEQFRREFYELYPSANILVPDGEGATYRRTFASRIATGDWDAVILPESEMTLIPTRPETRQAFLTQQIREMQAYQQEALDAERAAGVKSRSRTSKRMQAEIDKMVEQLQRVAAEVTKRQDNTIYWEDLGVDQLFVDEADRFKNLYFPSRMENMKGLSRTYNQKSDDMFLKTQNVIARNGGRGVVFATGTPVSNSIAELWTQMRYLMSGKLRDLGLDRFDAWRSQFANVGIRMERTVSGDYRATARFSQFENVPELSKLFHHTADVRMSEDNPDLGAMKPKLIDGKRTVIDVPASDEQSVFQKSLAARAEAIKTRQNDPRVDNMLKITDDAKKAALDLRLVLKGAKEFPDGKIPRLAKEVAQVYHDEAAKKGTQVIFLDMGTPKTMSEMTAKYRTKARVLAEQLKIPLDQALQKVMAGTDDLQEQLQIQNVYGQIKTKLIAAGIPEKEIAFIHDAKTDEAKKALFDRLNDGDVRVVIGSTEKLGAGSNFQRRLAALHHLDSPWRPRDIEQREGRILRQGNDMYGPAIERDPQTGAVTVTHPGTGVRIYQYVTKDSFDAYIWQAIEAKQRAIKSVIRGDSSERYAPDADQMVLSAGEIQAKVSGDPLIFDRMEALAAAETLERQKMAHQDAVLSARSSKAWNQSSIRAKQEALAAIQSDVQRIAQTPETFALTVDPAFANRKTAVTFTERARADELLRARAKEEMTAAPISHDNFTVVPVGSYRGMRVNLAIRKSVVLNEVETSAETWLTRPGLALPPSVPRDRIPETGVYRSFPFTLPHVEKVEFSTRLANVGGMVDEVGRELRSGIVTSQKAIDTADYTLQQQAFHGAPRLESLRNAIATIEAHLERKASLSEETTTTLRGQLQRIYKGESVPIAPPSVEAKGLGSSDESAVIDETAPDEAPTDESVQDTAPTSPAHRAGLRILDAAKSAGDDPPESLVMLHSGLSPADFRAGLQHIWEHPLLYFGVGITLEAANLALQRHQSEGEATLLGDSGAPIPGVNSVVDAIARFNLAGVAPRDFAVSLGMYNDNIVDPLAEVAFETLDLAPAGLAAILGAKGADRWGFFNQNNPAAFLTDGLPWASESAQAWFDTLKARAKERQQVAPAAYFLASVPFDPLNHFGWGEHYSTDAILSATSLGEQATGHGLSQLSRGAMVDRTAQLQALRFRQIAGSNDAKADDVLHAIQQKMLNGTATVDEAQLAHTLGVTTPVDSKAVIELAQLFGNRTLTEPSPELIDAIAKQVKGKHAWTDADVAWLRKTFDAAGPTNEATDTAARDWFERNAANLTTGKVKLTADAVNDLAHIFQNPAFEASKATVEKIGQFLEGRTTLRGSDLDWLRTRLGVPARTKRLIPKGPLDSWAKVHGVPDLSAVVNRAGGFTVGEFSGHLISTVRRQAAADRNLSPLAPLMEKHPFVTALLTTHFAPVAAALGTLHKRVILPLTLDFLATPSWPIHAARELSLRGYHPSVWADAARIAYGIPRAMLRDGKGFAAAVKSIPQLHDLNAVDDAYSAYYTQSMLGARGGMGAVQRANAIQPGIIPFLGGAPHEAGANLLRGAVSQLPADNLIRRLTEAGANVWQHAHLGALYGIEQHAVTGMEAALRKSFILREHPSALQQVLATRGQSAQTAFKALQGLVATRPAGLSAEVWRRVKPLAEASVQQGRLSDVVQNVIRGRIDRHALALSAFWEEGLPLSAQTEFWGALAHATPEELQSYFAKGGGAEKVLDAALEFEHGDRLDALVKEVTQRADLATAAGRRAAWKEIQSGLDAGMEFHRNLWDWAWQVSAGATEPEKDRIFAAVREIRQRLMGAEQRDAKRARDLFYGHALAKRRIPFPKDVLQMWDQTWAERSQAFRESDQRWTEYWAQVRRGAAKRTDINQVRDLNDQTWQTYRANRQGTDEQIYARLEDFFSRRRKAANPEDIVYVTPEPLREVSQEARDAASTALNHLRANLEQYVARPTLDPKQTQVLTDWAQSVDKAVSGLPPEALQSVEEANQQAASLVTEAANRRFVDHANRTNLDEFARAAIPFWMYDVKGGVFYAWLMQHVPGAATTLDRYLDQTNGTGYFQGDYGPFGTAMNPMRGLWSERLVALSTHLAKYRPQSAQGVIDDALKGIVQSGIASARLTPGLTIPAEIAQGQSLSQVDWPPAMQIADDIKAALGGGMIRDDVHTQYRIRSLLGAEGINPDTATPQQVNAAQREEGPRAAAQTLLPMFTDTTPALLAERRDFQSELKKYGISRAQQDALTSQGISPWKALNDQQKRDVMARHPGWSYLFDAGQVFDPPQVRADKQAVSAFVEKLHTLSTDRITAQQKDDAQLRSGKLAPSAWMNQRSARMQSYLGGKDVATSLYPQAVRILDDPARVATMQPEDQAVARYYQKQSDLIAANLNPDTGKPNWAVIEPALQQWTATLPVDQQRYVHDATTRNETDTERLWKSALTEYQQYTAIPRWVGISADAAAKRVEMERSYVQLRAINPTAAAAYRLLPSHALLRQKLPANPARAAFLRAHPQMQFFFVTPQAAKLKPGTPDANYTVLDDPVEAPWSPIPESTGPLVAPALAALQGGTGQAPMPQGAVPQRIGAGGATGP